MPTDSTYNSISYNSTVVTSTTIVATSSSTPWPLFLQINKNTDVKRVYSMTHWYDSLLRYLRKSFLEWHIKLSNCWYTRKVNKQQTATILEFYPSVWFFNFREKTFKRLWKIQDWIKKYNSMGHIILKHSL